MLPIIAYSLRFFHTDNSDALQWSRTRTRKKASNAHPSFPRPAGTERTEAKLSNSDGFFPWWFQRG